LLPYFVKTVKAIPGLVFLFENLQNETIRRVQTTLYLSLEFLAQNWILIIYLIQKNEKSEIKKNFGNKFSKKSAKKSSKKSVKKSPIKSWGRVTKCRLMTIFPSENWKKQPLVIFMTNDRPRSVRVKLLLDCKGIDWFIALP